MKAILRLGTDRIDLTACEIATKRHVERNLIPSHLEREKEVLGSSLEVVPQDIAEYWLNKINATHESLILSD